jgi:hypothetical protein
MMRTPKKAYLPAPAQQSIGMQGENDRGDSDLSLPSIVIGVHRQVAGKVWWSGLIFSLGVCLLTGIGPFGQSTSAGLVTVLVGLGVIVRPDLDRALAQNVVWRSGRQSAQIDIGLLSCVMDVWAFVESLFVALFRLTLVVFCFMLVVSLLAGGPPSWGLLDLTLRRILEISFTVWQMIRAEYPGCSCSGGN